MNDEQLIKIMQDIAAIWESLKSAHKRIDESDALTAQIHKLATSIETLTVQLRNQNERLEMMINNFENRMKAQGERIGELEAKPAKKWEHSVTQVVSLVLAAVAGFIASKFS